MHSGRDQLGGGVWAEAWRGRADNPLLARWRLGAGRALELKPWWGRNPLLLLLCAAVSACATYLLLLLLRDYFIVRHSAVASRAFMLGLLQSGVVLLAWTGLAMSALWLLGRLYNVAVFALSLLGQGRPQAGALQDEALQSSALRDEQVVLAAVLHAWRSVTAPLLALCACAAVVYGLALAQPASPGQAAASALQAGAMATTQAAASEALQAAMSAAAEASDVAAAAWWVALVLAALFFVVTLLGAYAGAACLVLLLIILGRGLGPLAPSIGAAQIVLWQGGMAVAALFSRNTGGPGLDLGPSESASAVVALVLGVTLAWLAQCLKPLRIAGAYAPLVLIALETALCAMAAASSPYAVPDGAMICLQAWLYLSLCAAVLPIRASYHLSTALVLGGGATGGAMDFAVYGGLYILVQCLLACVLALLARSAVRRFRGGQP